MKNNYVKLTLFLAIVAALATGILAGVNELTKDIITGQQSDAQTAELKNLFPEASAFTPVEFEPDAQGTVLEAYKVDDSGFVFKAQAEGYADTIIVLIGYDKDGSNSRFAFLQNNESVGFGDQLDTDKWLPSVQGIDAADELPLYTGATTTTNAVRKAVSGAVEVLSQLAGLEVEAPEVVEPEKPVLKLVDETDTFVGALREEDPNEETQEYTYIVVGPGYKEEIMGEPSVNRFEVVIDGATDTIKSVTNLSNNDSEGISEPAVAQDYLDTFVGLDINDGDAEVDAASGATITSKSVMRAIRAAVEAYKNK